MDKILLNNGEAYDILMAGEDSGFLWIDFYNISTLELLPVLIDPENTKKIIVRKDEVYLGYIEITNVMVDSFRNVVSIALRKPQ